MPDHVVIVGGGVAAMRCALELRERGFDGHLSMLCAESTPPYDRTLVSKALISGDPVDAERLLLQSLDAYNDAARASSSRPKTNAFPTAARAQFPGMQDRQRFPMARIEHRLLDA